MKFSIKNAMFGQAMRRVSPALIKAKNPVDPGQYIVISADQDEVSFAVSGVELAARATVSAKAMDGAIVKVSNGGSCTVGGEKISRIPELVKVADNLDFDTKDSDVVPQEGDEASVKEIGTVSATYPGHKGRMEFFEFPRVDLAPLSKLDYDASTKVVIKGEDFLTYIRQVKIAVGESTMSEKFTNILFRISGGDVELATSNGQQLAWAKFPAVSTSRDIMCVTSFDQFETVSKMCEPDRDVVVYLGATEFKTLVVTQEITFGNEVVGSLVAKINSTSDAFMQFEKKLDALNFPYECTINRQQAKECFDKINLYERAKSAVCFDPAEGLIIVKKTDAKGKTLATLPISNATGDKLELDIASRHIKAGIDASSSDELPLKFSGRRSMALLVLGPRVKMFFMPFGDL